MPTDSAISDEALVEIVRTQDQEQYAQLVDRYQTKLLRYARYLVGDDDLAADVVQDAFIKAFVNLAGFDTKRRFSSWLYRIVHNQAMNAVRRRQPISLEDNDWIGRTLRGPTNLEAELHAKQRHAELRRAVAALPIHYREPLALAYFEQYRYEEISDMLRLPIGTVGTRINRAKQLLRTALEADGRDDAR